MPVLDVPLASLDNSSDLMDWLANELVTNHHFTEKRRLGNVTDNDIELVVERALGDTFHGHTMLLALDKGANTETATNKEFQFNLAPKTYEATYRTTTPDAGLIVNWSVVNNEIVLQPGSTSTSWVTLGYSTGELIRISNAATGANDGLYEIITISTDTLTQDTLEFKDVSAGGSKDVDTADTSDTITGVEEIANLNNVPHFYNGERTKSVAWSAPMSHMDDAPYQRARLITSEDSDSASPTVPLYFILIVETSVTGVFRQMVFGEVEKLVDFNGGLFFSGGHFSDTSDIDTSIHNSWCQGYVGAGRGESSNGGNSPGGVWSDDWVSGIDTEENGWGWLGFGAYGTVLGDAPTHYTAAILPHFLGIGKDIVGYSPSGFSGQSERWPLMVFGAINTKSYITTEVEVAPMCIIPDIFLADITNVDAYSVFEDDYGEKFMVVPMYTKNGSGVGSSEKWGYLIRNPDLVVT